MDQPRPSKQSLTWGEPKRGNHDTKNSNLIRCSAHNVPVVVGSHLVSRAADFVTGTLADGGWRQLLTSRAVVRRLLCVNRLQDVSACVNLNVALQRQEGAGQRGERAARSETCRWCQESGAGKGWHLARAGRISFIDGKTTAQICIDHVNWFQPICSADSRRPNKVSENAACCCCCCCCCCLQLPMILNTITSFSMIWTEKSAADLLTAPFFKDLKRNFMDFSTDFQRFLGFFENISRIFKVFQRFSENF